MRPLNRLAEVETVSGSDSMHMFYDTGHVRHILTREVACFSCDSCKQMRWRQCTNTAMCGHVTSKDVKVKKQATAPLTATRVVREGKEAASKVQPGVVVCVECASEQEPYVILKATSELYQWAGEDEYTWMGWVRAGDWVLDTIKYEKYGGSDAFWVLTEKRFPVFQEDLRTIVTNCEPVAVRQSHRVQTAPTQRIEIQKSEITLLEERVMVNANPKPKAKDRPRGQSGDRRRS